MAPAADSTTNGAATAPPLASAVIAFDAGPTDSEELVDDFAAVDAAEEYPRFLGCWCKPLLCCCCVSLECWLRGFAFGFIVMGLAGVLGIPGVVEEIYLYEGVFYCICSLLSVAVGILIWTALSRESAKLMRVASRCLLAKYLFVVLGYLVAEFVIPGARAAGAVAAPLEAARGPAAASLPRAFSALALPPLLLDGAFYLAVYYFMWSYAALVDGPPRAASFAATSLPTSLDASASSGGAELRHAASAPLAFQPPAPAPAAAPAGAPGSAADARVPAVSQPLP